MNVKTLPSLNHPTAMGRSRPRTSRVDKCAFVPVAGFLFSMIGFPLLQLLNPDDLHGTLTGTAPRPEVRLFWIPVALTTVLLIAQNRSRLSRLAWPPHIIWLAAYLAFAGASVVWAVRPESTLIRFILQSMIVTSMVLPTMLTAQKTDIVRALFLCCALGLFLNVPFVLSGTATYANTGVIVEYIGSPGYFSFKNYLGEFAALGLLLSLSEILHRGGRRIFGIACAAIAMYLIIVSQSKTALAMALIAPGLAWMALLARKTFRVSAAVVLSLIPLGYTVLSRVSHYNIYLLSYKLYGESTLSGRAYIWGFVENEIARKPLFGWGYESFWLVPDSPAMSGGAGWIGTMPNGHNGYYDTKLALGYIGFGLLIGFIFSTIHALGRVADRNFSRAWILLSVALYVILHNLLESIWMNSFEMLWLVFLVVAAEAARYWQLLPSRRRNRRPSRVPHTALS